MIFWKLFFTFFKIGLFNFGGGYAMISFIQHEVVYKQAWLNTAEFTDIVAVSQMTPGPIGINLATYTGYTAGHDWFLTALGPQGAAWGGVLGSCVATFAVCLPSFILMLLVSKYFLKYKDSSGVKAVFGALRPAVVGLIAAAALVLCNADNFIDYKSVLFFAGAFCATYFFKLGPVKIIFLSGILGFLVY